MNARLDHDVAASNMRLRGAEPLEPYTNALTAWRCRCLECEEVITPIRECGEFRPRAMHLLQSPGEVVEQGCNFPDAAGRGGPPRGVSRIE